MIERRSIKVKEIQTEIKERQGTKNIDREIESYEEHEQAERAERERERERETDRQTDRQTDRVKK